MKKLATVLICLGVFHATMNAQIIISSSVMSSNGGYDKGGDKSISWTLGDFAITTVEGGNMILTQGFQQPNDIDVGIKPNEKYWAISVYPNPVGDELRIWFGLKAPGDYFIEIQDVTGRVIYQDLQRNVRPDDILTLNTSSYMHGVYLLKISTSDKQQFQATVLLKL